MSTLKVDAIRHNSATNDAITLASDASNISIGSSVFHGIKSTLITNGDFSNGTANWTATTSTLSETSGVLTLTPNSGVNGFASQTVTNLVVGKHYNIQVTVTQDAGSYARLYVGTSANGNQNVYTLNLGVGTHSSSFKATATTHYVSLVVGGGTGQATKFDDVRLIESNSITFSTPTGDAPSLRPYAFDGMSINTGGVDRLIVSKEGYVTKPNTPFFAVHGSASNQTYNQDTDLTFENTSQNVGGHFKTTSGTGQYERFIAPVAGVYMFTMGFFPNSASSCRISLAVNGNVQTNPYISGCFTAWGTGQPVPMGSQMLKLNANDYVTVQVQIGTLTNTYDGHTGFQGFLLG